MIPNSPFHISEAQLNPPNGTAEIWLFCTDLMETKSNLMNLIIKSKIKKQQAAGVNYILHKEKKSREQKSITQIMGDDNKTNSNANEKKDGHWTVIQNWSQCSLKCGGGEQTIQLQCIKPENGGKPCEGESIRKRNCNTDPCAVPQVFDKSKILKPIIRRMPISNKPQRYDKCKLKETDVFVNFEKLDLESTTEEILTNGAQILVRVVMNNKSISLFKTDNASSNIFTLPLEGTSFKRIKNSERCFSLEGKNESKSIIMCSITSDEKEFTESWDYDFNQFKNECKEVRPIIAALDDDIKKILNDKLKKIKNDIMNEKSDKLRKASDDEEKKNVKKKLDQTQAMSLLAMQKENKLEQLLEKEEKMRELQDEKDLEIQLKSELKKRETLMKSLKNKQLEDEYNISKQKSEEAIKKVKDEAQNQILKKREEIKKKIALMRQRSERKKAGIKSKIISARKETANKIKQFSRKGDVNRCFSPNNVTGDNSNKRDNKSGEDTKPYSKQLEMIETFCQSAFTDNIEKLIDCKSPESFCFVCCEAEFGEMHLTEREKCYNEKCNK